MDVILFDLEYQECLYRPPQSLLWRVEGGILYVLEGWGHNCLPTLCFWTGWRRDHLGLRWWTGTAASPPASSWMEQTWDHVGFRKIRGRASLLSFACLRHWRDTNVGYIVSGLKEFKIQFEGKYQWAFTEKKSADNTTDAQVTRKRYIQQVELELDASKYWPS